MSLVAFHRLLILAGIIFCAGYALWELLAFLDGAGPRSLLLALVFGAGALGLGYYLRNLSRFLGIQGSGDDPPPPPVI